MSSDIGSPKGIPPPPLALDLDVCDSLLRSPGLLDVPFKARLRVPFESSA